MNIRIVESEADIKATDLVDLYHYWHKSGGVTCRLDHFDLIEIPELLPLVLLASPIPSEDDMIIRYTGKVVVEYLKRDLTETRASQWKSVFPPAWQVITETALTGRPHIYGPAHVVDPA